MLKISSPLSGAYVIPILTFFLVVLAYEIYKSYQDNYIAAARFLRVCFIGGIILHQITQFLVVTTQTSSSSCFTLRQCQFIAGVMTFGSALLIGIDVFENLLDDAETYLQRLQMNIFTHGILWLRRATWVLTLVLVSPFFYLQGEYDDLCRIGDRATRLVVIGASLMGLLYVFLQIAYCFIALLFFKSQDDSIKVEPHRHVFSKVYKNFLTFSMQTVVSIVTLFLCAVLFPMGRKFFFQIYAVSMYTLLTLNSTDMSLFSTIKNQSVSSEAMLRFSRNSIKKNHIPTSSLSSNKFVAQSSLSSLQPDSHNSTSSDKHSYKPSFYLRHSRPSVDLTEEVNMDRISIATSDQSDDLSTIDNSTLKNYAGYVRFPDETSHSLKERQRIKAVWNTRHAYNLPLYEGCPTDFGGESAYSETGVYSETLSAGGESILSDVSYSVGGGWV